MSLSHPSQETDLGDLLAGVARAVLQVQDHLDADGSLKTTEYVRLPAKTLALPPLCFAVKDAAVEIELAGDLTEGNLVCRLMNPNSVALYGYQASSGMKVRLVIGPSFSRSIEQISDE